MLTYNKKKEVITICDKKTGKEAVFTPARWASFRLYMDEVDDQLNSLSQDRDVAYCAHYGGGCHVCVNTGYRCVDLRKWYDRTQTDEDGHRTTSVRLVYVQADSPASTPRLPGRHQLHGVLSRSSTRPSDLHGMQHVSDPAVNKRCMFVTLCDRWFQR